MQLEEHSFWGSEGLGLLCLSPVVSLSALSERRGHFSRVIPKETLRVTPVQPSQKRSTHIQRDRVKHRDQIGPFQNDPISFNYALATLLTDHMKIKLAGQATDFPV